ncbi:MAG: hypothetical protein AAF493_01495 [Pseudomonadota bacterium]
MSNDPYQPPSSHRPPTPPRNALGWKVFFWLLALMMYLGVSGLPPLWTLSVFDLIDLAISFVTIAGMFGFAYSRPLGSVVFWRYFFYVALIDSILMSVLFPLIGVARYGQVATFGFAYVFELAFVWVVLYALHSYAFRSPTVWPPKSSLAPRED